MTPVAATPSLAATGMTQGEAGSLMSLLGAGALLAALGIALVGGSRLVRRARI